MDSERVHPFFCALSDGRIQRLGQVWMVSECVHPKVGIVLSKGCRKSSKGFGWDAVTSIKSIIWLSMWFCENAWMVPELCLTLHRQSTTSDLWLTATKDTTGRPEDCEITNTNDHVRKATLCLQRIEQEFFMNDIFDNFWALMAIYVEYKTRIEHELTMN